MGPTKRKHVMIRALKDAVCMTFAFLYLFTPAIGMGMAVFLALYLFFYVINTIVVSVYHMF